MNCFEPLSLWSWIYAYVQQAKLSNKLWMTMKNYHPDCQFLLSLFILGRDGAGCLNSCKALGGEIHMVLPAMKGGCWSKEVFRMQGGADWPEVSCESLVLLFHLCSESRSPTRIWESGIRPVQTLQMTSDKCLLPSLSLYIETQAVTHPNFAGSCAAVSRFCLLFLCWISVPTNPQTSCT